jgi:Flp pilus assembly protein TadG
MMDKHAIPGVLAKLKHFSRSIDGGIATLTALILPLLIGFAGMGVAVGVWLDSKRALQSQADSGALAGLSEVLGAGGTATMINAANTVMTRNGYSGGTCNSTTCTVTYLNAGPMFGGKAVQVDVNKDQPLLFANIYPGLNVNVGVTATAEAVSIGDACILALASSSSVTGVSITGNTTQDFGNCIVAANSIAPDAITGSGNITVTAQALVTSGGYNQNGNVTMNLDEGIITGSPPVSDPLATFNPTLPGATTWNGTTCSGNPSGQAPTITASGTYSPTGGTLTAGGTVTTTGGKYCGINIGNGTTVTLGTGTYYINGSISMTGGTLNLGTLATGPTAASLSNSTNYSTYYIKGGLSVTGGQLNLGPGVYYFYGGGININGGGVKGYGVSFVITGPTNCGNACKVTINGNGNVQLSPIPAAYGATLTAPYSTFAGMMLYFDRNINLLTNGVTLNGTATDYVSGVVYAPNQQITYAGTLQQGSGGGGTCTRIISYTLKLTGSSNTSTGTFSATDCTNLTGNVGQAQVYVARLVK